MSRAHFIREWRALRGVTQEEMADALGLSPGYLSDVERGKKRYNQSIIEAAAAFLRCTPAELLAGPPGAGVDQVEVAIDSRLLYLCVKITIEEALQGDARLSSRQIADIAETSARTYEAYLKARGTEPQRSRG